MAARAIKIDNLGKAITALRKEACMTNPEISKYTGIGCYLVKNMQYNLKYDVLERLEKVFDCIGYKMHIVIEEKE